jgi:hypothetical protein
MRKENSPCIDSPLPQASRLALGDVVLELRAIAQRLECARLALEELEASVRAAIAGAGRVPPPANAGGLAFAGNRPLPPCAGELWNGR